MVLCALMLALMTVSAWITIPLGPVPVTLQVFVMIFAALVLPGTLPVAVVALYILMGVIGLPVFAGMRGGLGVIMGPTGGFIGGFLVGVIAVVALRLVVSRMWGAERLASKRAQWVLDILSSAAFLVVCYVCGWAQLTLVTGMTPMAALAAGVLPFIAIDAIKVILACILAHNIRPVVMK